MELPEIDLTDFTSADLKVLELWWKNESIANYVGPLEHQLRPSVGGSRISAGIYRARPLQRWMARDPETSAPIGYVSVQVTGDGGPNEGDPVNPPFHGGVNIAVDPKRQCGGIGTAILMALLTHADLADVATLGGVVEAKNHGSLGMLRKVDVVANVTEGEVEKRRDKLFRHFVIESSRPSDAPFDRR
ncbi:GNAT family N-acetyltransferase [Nocardia aurea]|uniref:GNAT family N-acetyltransferase n=1 Tax=Nocardia aurea TaxID=2144174 RepID=UPI0013004A20|nr:GNAT family N-acetyltransferase [Nocardia aurea]